MHAIMTHFKLLLEDEEDEDVAALCTKRHTLKFIRLQKR